MHSKTGTAAQRDSLGLGVSTRVGVGGCFVLLIVGAAFGWRAWPSGADLARFRREWPVAMTSASPWAARFPPARVPVSLALALALGGVVFVPKYYQRQPPAQPSPSLLYHPFHRASSRPVACQPLQHPHTPRRPLPIATGRPRISHALPHDFPRRWAARALQLISSKQTASQLPARLLRRSPPAHPGLHVWPLPTPCKLAAPTPSSPGAVQPTAGSSTAALPPSRA